MTERLDSHFSLTKAGLPCGHWRLRSNGKFFHGEVRGNSVHVLKKPYWLGLELEGSAVMLGDVQIDLPVAPSKVIAVGLNYADHIKEMQRTPLGTP